MAAKWLVIITVLAVVGADTSEQNRENIHEGSIVDVVRSSERVTRNNNVKRSSGQGIDEENPDTFDNDFKRSNGQGIDEEHPDSFNKVFRRSSGQGIDEENPDTFDGDFKRSNGQGIDEEHPDSFNKVFRRSSGQGIDEENPDTFGEDSKRSSGQGIDEEHPYSFNNAFKRSSGQGIDEENPDSMVEVLKRSSGQRIDEEHSENLGFEDGEVRDEDYENLRVEDVEDSHLPLGFVMFNAIYAADVNATVIKLNRGVDFVLGAMNALFFLEGGSIKLSNINAPFRGALWGSFNATGGSFSNPGSLERTGDVAIILDSGSKVSLEVALGFKKLVVSYDHYDLEVVKIRQNGSLGFSVTDNSIKMKISLVYSPSCKFGVDQMELDKLDGIKANISGLGPLQSLFDMISKWLIDNFTGTFKKIINEKLMENARKVVEKEDVCKYFPSWL